jgi:hypothetical protein
MMQQTYVTFQEAFTGIIKDIHKFPNGIYPSRNGDMYERLGFYYTVINPTSFKFDNEKLGRIPYQYAEDFYKWMMAGSTPEDTKILAAKYPQVAGFLEKPKSKHIPENFNAFYGTRIAEQLPAVLKELKSHKNSRRAVINILDKQDLLLLDAEEDSNLEYPCCDSCTLSIRDGRLHTHVHMRSNNMGNVAKLDMYIWGRFQCEMAEELGVEIGKFTCSIVSAHIFEADFDYFKSLEII